MRDWLRRRRPDLLVVLLFLILPALFLAPVLIGGRVLLPTDVLTTFEPERQEYYKDQRGPSDFYDFIARPVRP